MGKSLLLLWCLTLGLMSLAGLSILQHQEQLTLLLHPALLPFALGEFGAVSAPGRQSTWHKGVSVGPCSSPHIICRQSQVWELGKHGGRIWEVNQGLRGKCSLFWASYLEEFQWFTVWGNAKKRQDRQLACLTAEWLCSSENILSRCILRSDSFALPGRDCSVIL